MTIKAKPPVQHWIIRADGTEFPLHTIEWLQVGNPTGLGIPRFTTVEEIVLERGALQHGSTAVLFKLPATRKWELPLSVAFCENPDKALRVLQLMNVFNPVYHANGKLTMPVAHRYKRVEKVGYGPDVTRYIDFFLESGLDGEPNLSDDGQYYDFTLRMNSPTVTLYGELSSNFRTLDTMFDNGVAHEWYSGALGIADTLYADLNLWVTCPTLYFSSDHPLWGATGFKGFIVYDLTDGVKHYIRHADYPTGGWPGHGTAPSPVYILSTCQNQQSLVLDNPPPTTDTNYTPTINPQNTEWPILIPDHSYKFGIEVANTTTAVNIILFVDYYPRYTGVTV